VCGLAGIVDFSDSVDPHEVVQMARALAHRGPDDNGSWDAPGVALAACRLAIIDLSEAGHQPMADETGRFRLLHNGEIYNYLELRAELEGYGHRFRTQTDTEVVLASYAEWGADCVTHFNGMWAFAIWDDRKRELFCSRDRFGEKPLYYTLRGGRLLFASELKAFRGLVPWTPNARMVRSFLEHGLADHTDATFFAGITQLPPAHSLTFSRDGLRITRYWELHPDAEPDGDPVDRLRELVLDAVRLRLRADVRVGTCLSGGIDSSAIACAVDNLLRTEAASARPVGERQEFFTVFFEDPGLDERPFVRAVATQTGGRSHFVSFAGSELVENLPAIAKAQDEPFRSTSVAAQWMIMRTARAAGMKVMLDGQGGDEVFGGYHGYFGFFFADLLLGGELGQLRSELRAYRDIHGATHARVLAALARPFVPDPLQWFVRARTTAASSLVHSDLRRARPELLPETNSFPDHLRRQLHLVLTRRLTELLRYEDRNSMTHSIEARLPFLDHRLVELMFSLPPRHLIESARTKVILRRAFEGVLPESVRARTDKLGFETPEGRWLRGPLGDFAEEVFHSPAFRDRGFSDAAATQRRLRLHRQRRVSAGFELWRALSLELWARTTLDAATPHVSVAASA
jgi:asparagine synthase (glutamine-hydrolysing)